VNYILVRFFSTTVFNPSSPIRILLHKKDERKTLNSPQIITTMKNLVLTIATIFSLNSFATQATNSLPKTGIPTSTINLTPTTSVPAPVVAAETNASVQTTISMSPSHNGAGTVQVLNTNQPITISIADLSGKNVFEKTISGNTFDLAGTMTTSGIYIISIKQNDSVISSKTWIVAK